MLKSISPFDLGAHRVVWTLVFVLALIAIRDRSISWLKKVTPDVFRKIIIASSLITFNWICFIWAVNTDRILLASLGYYMNPLVNVLLGRIFLNERLSRAQMFSVVLAVIAVVNLTASIGELPWVSIGLAISFGFYGLIKKSIPLGSIRGLGIESAFIAPFAIVYLAMFSSPRIETYIFSDWSFTGMLIVGGAVTALPLIWFNSAAQRLRLSTLGFFQYLAPSISVGLAIWIYGEPFTSTYKITFGLIGAALLIFVIDNLRQVKARGGFAKN